MKMMKRIALISLVLLALATTAGAVDYANPQSIAKGGSGKVSINLQNQDRDAKNGTLEVIGTDAAGSVIASFSQPVYIDGDSNKSVEFNFQAPQYATNLYWSAKVLAPASSDDHEDDHEDDDHHDDDDEHDDD